jgi:hypothetical protein
METKAPNPLGIKPEVAERSGENVTLLTDSSASSKKVKVSR